MREIEFRGKRKDNGNWVYGDLLQPIAICHIYEISDKNSIDGARYEVDPETVGEYTGRKDVKENKIYTDDIVKSGEGIGLVVFDKEYLGYFVNFEEQEPLYDVYIEKIGNIHDNPKLLERKN